MVTSSFKKKNMKILKLKNPILFLNNFAKLKREYSLAKIIAITGSAGKTSLKNLIKDLLTKLWKNIFFPKVF